MVRMMSQFHLKRSPKDAPKKHKRRKYVAPEPAKECDIVDQQGNRTRFFSMKSAKRALSAIVSTLAPKKTPDEPKKVWIE